MGSSPAAARVPQAQEPYPGPRPFERHEGDRYHGRKIDSQILCDRILAGRITILYAQSGLGKSSLLRTRVVPRLEDAGSLAIYFDNWSQPDPLVTLKDALAAHASKIGVVDPGFGSPTITELIRLISGVDGANVVLVLDQFEEFLVRQADRLEALRDELAALIRSPRLDASIVLSLREEYLAALEPFRQRIANLFESAYRLEELPEADLRDAILEPPKIYGGACEPALATQLINDLRGRSEQPGSDKATLFVGLPMLQLVCQELWKQVKDGDKKLTLALYQDLGGAQRIIDSYVSDMMPRSGRDKSVTARLLRLLAPGSGLKTPYSAEDLASNTKLPLEVVQKELLRLSQARILRTRDYNNVVLYELQHDAFIRVLREWRDVVLAHDRLRKRMLQVAAVAVVIGGMAFSLYAAIRESRVKTEVAAAKKMAEMSARHEIDKVKASQKLDEKDFELKKSKEFMEGGYLGELLGEKDQQKRDALASSRFDVMTSYFLVDVNDPKGLQDKLQLYKDLLPANYALRSPTVEKSGPSSLTVRHSIARRWDDAQFMILWHDFALEISRSYGFPVPLQVRLETQYDATVGADEISVRFANNETRKVKAPTYENDLLVRFQPSDIRDPSLVAQRTRYFLEHYVNHRPFPADSRWSLVPRWSLPAWKAAKDADPKVPFKEVATDASGIAAYHVLVELLGLKDEQKNARKALMGAPAVEALLRSASRSYPVTVREARAGAGACLGPRLAEEVDHDPYALLALPLLLDKLADEPCEPRDRQTSASAHSGEQASSPQSQNLGGAPPSRGPRSKPSGQDSDTPETLDAYTGLELPVSYSPFWVYGRKNPSDDVTQKIADELYRRYGVTVTSGNIHWASDDDRAPSGAVRVNIPAGGDAAAVIQSAAERNRSLWITPEAMTAMIDLMPPKLQAWIHRQYSATAMKQLARLVIGGKPEDGGSMRYPAWLLSSLYFWSVDRPDAMGSGKTNDLAGLLRRTERARMHPPSAECPPAIRDAIERGADSLATDDPPGALEQFSRAIALNRAQAEDAFLQAWARRLPQLWMASARANFENLRTLRLESPDRIDLEELRPDSRLDAQIYREVSVNRLAAGVAATAERTSLLHDMLSRAAMPDAWPAEQARWVAVEFLKGYDPFDSKTGNAREFDSACALMQSAVKRLSAADALKAFQDVVDLSQTAPGDSAGSRDIPNWGWTVLNRLTDARPGGAQSNLQLELGWHLAFEERPERLKRALALLSNFETVIGTSDLSAEERSNQLELLNYARANAYYLMGSGGDRAALQESEQRFRKTRASKWVLEQRSDLAQTADQRIIDILHETGRGKEASSWFQKAIGKWHEEDGYIDASELFGLLREGNSTAAAGVAHRAADRAAHVGAGGQNGEWYFVAATGSILTQSGDWRGLTRRYLGKDIAHGYKDYVLIIQEAFDRGTPSSKLSPAFNQRLGEIAGRKANWPARLRNGEMSAWREMLVSRFAAPETSPLLELMTDEAKFSASDLKSLPSTRRGLQCEFWFYEAMRAKAAGQRDYMRECLRHCIDVGFIGYLEDSMARFLLAKGA